MDATSMASIDPSTNSIVINSSTLTTADTGVYHMRFTLDNGATVDSNNFQIDIDTNAPNTVDGAMAHCVDCAFTTLESQDLAQFTWSFPFDGYGSTSDFIINRHEDSLSVAASEVLLACGPRVYTLADSTGNTNILVYIDDDGVSPDFKLQAVNNDPSVIGLNEYTLTVGLLDYPSVPAITEQIKIDIFCDVSPY